MGKETWKIIKQVRKEIDNRTEVMKREIKEINKEVKFDMEHLDDFYNTEEDKTAYEIDPDNYKKVLKYIIETGERRSTEIVKKFQIGFMKAISFIEDYKKKNYISLNKITNKYDTIAEEEYNELFSENS